MLSSPGSSTSIPAGDLQMGEPRRFSVHNALGGDAVADVLLWKKWYRSVVLLVTSTALWFLFERAGYNLLSFIANVLFSLVVILFFWAKSASLLNRPLPPLPNIDVSEETLVKAADVVRVWINYVLSIAHNIAIGGNLKLSCQLAIGLWIISIIGSLFNFLTLVYIGVLLCLSLPIVYDKHQNAIDNKLNAAYKIAYRMVDDMLLSKIPWPPNKEKKTQ